MGGEFDVYKALKREDGYDVSIQEEGYYKSFYQSAIRLWEKMIKSRGESR